jgi:hypothetical protein
VVFVVHKETVGQVFLPKLRFSPFSTSPPMLHTHLHLHVALTRRTNGRNTETIEKRCSVGNRGAFDRKVLPLRLSGLACGVRCSEYSH